MEVGGIGRDDMEHEGGEGEENECPLICMPIAQYVASFKLNLWERPEN
jgi:hypothetical protein